MHILIYRYIAITRFLFYVTISKEFKELLIHWPKCKTCDSCSSIKGNASSYLGQCIANYMR